MKYHMVFKFLAVLLCACCLFASVGSGLGILALVEANLYNISFEELKLQQAEREFSTAARLIAGYYAMTELSNCPQDMIRVYLNDYYGRETFDGIMGRWIYTLEDESGTLLYSNMPSGGTTGEMVFEDLVTVTYPVVLNYTLKDLYTGEVLNPTEPSQLREGDSETIPQEAFIAGTVRPATAQEDYEYVEHWGYGTEEGFHEYTLGIRIGPVYLLTLYPVAGIYEPEAHWAWDLAEFGYANRYNLIWVLGASLLLFAMCFVYLCCAAGRRPGSEETAPGGLNRMPLDLYGVLTAVTAAALAAGTFELIRWNLEYFDPKWLMALLICVMAFAACLLVVAFLFACAAQFKMRHFYWAKNSLIGLTLWGTVKLISKCLRGVKRMTGKLPGGENRLLTACRWAYAAVRKTVLALWTAASALIKGMFSLVGKAAGFLWRCLVRFAGMLPLTWQWLLVGFVMVFVLMASLSSHNTAGEFFGLVLCLCIVMYGAHCFGTLLESTKRMSQGDLDTKVEDKLLLGSFREHAQHLNDLAGVAVEAARKQMKSERMKAELVTNVSHDIKTPLTSIINYVDLLQKAETPEQTAEYLEVLSRQSQRLKKLIEDLMEMSKASTGNMAVELTGVDAVESITQALGEFSDKLEQAQLTPVFEPPEEPVRMVADGRLSWRVLSNLLSNAVKYALPGTRPYIDLVRLDGRVLISLKNISREQLNVSSEELMERFVRGDASRNTEGSGLGLNIARSLMELQKGQLQLLVDGDLFKATLIFPEETGR